MGTNKFAQANRWNAYRYPTEDEYSRGRAEWDMFWVGADISRDVARRMLDEHGGGQLQFGEDGRVENV